MTIPFRALITAITPIFLLASCAVPGVKLVTQPLTDNPVVGTLLNPNKLTPETRAHLQEENLLTVYRKNRFEAIETLRERLAENPGYERRFALIELCTNTGDQLAENDVPKAVGYHLAAAELAYDGAGFDASSLSEKKELVAAYNHSAGQVARLLFYDGHDWEKTASIEGPGKTYRLRCRTQGKEFIEPDFFDRLEPADFLEFEKVEFERNRREGVGSAMVGYRTATPERREANPFLPPVGMALPVNATLEFRGDGANVELALHDLLERDEAELGGRTLTLAADHSAPFATLIEFQKDRKVGIKGLKNPEKYIDSMGLYQLKPYRTDQIPVVLVHGLMSSPGTWVTALNAFRYDPVLRSKYQLYVFAYPTGFPIAYNAAALRRRLAEFQEHFDPDRRNPHMRNMILVGHSMGGMLSNMQIRDSGDSFTRLLFDRPIDELGGLDEVQRNALKELMIYEANPDITRVVFVASPHRGSELATGFVGNLGRKLIKFPIDVLTVEPLPEIEGLTQTGHDIIINRPDSISALKPDAPGPRAVLKQPIRKGVTIHSVIGRAKPEQPLLESSDKVVPYTSAHLDEAVSEKVVHATHTTITGNAEAIEEARRILYLHAGLPYEPAN